jgi:hypothetical protein
MPHSFAPCPIMMRCPFNDISPCIPFCAEDLPACARKSCDKRQQSSVESHGALDSMSIERASIVVRPPQSVSCILAMATG